MIDFIPVNEPILNGNEKKYLYECIKTGWISSEGPFVKIFEDKFANVAGRKHGIAVCNGTAAIDLAVTAIDIKEGDEVILPTFTIISCINQIVRTGAIPVLIDSDPITWNMNVSQIEQRITSRTKAIMVVHIYGLPVDMDPVIELARVYDIKIIEDAAEMHGQSYKGRPCGSFGDISTFSFYPNKLVTTGEGGIVVTNDDAIADRCRSLRNLCFQSSKRFVHEELGWNMRMTNLQASLGIAQIERLEEFINSKRRMGRRYDELLSNTPGIQIPLQKADYAENIYWVYGLMLKDDIPIDAQEVMKKLSELKIGTRPFFWCMHEQPVLKKMGLFRGERYPVAENMARRGFYVPSGLGIRDDQIQRVAESVQKVLSEVA